MVLDLNCIYIEQVTFKMNNLHLRRVPKFTSDEVNFIQFSSLPKLTKISILLIHFTYCSTYNHIN